MRLFSSLLLLAASFQMAVAQKPVDAREVFIEEQNAYLQQLNLDFFQNKEYQILTRNFDKQAMRINLSDIPKGLKKKRVNKLKKEKDRQMKKLLSPAQYKLYVRRQKVIDKTLSADW